MKRLVYLFFLGAVFFGGSSCSRTDLKGQSPVNYQGGEDGLDANPPRTANLV